MGFYCKKATVKYCKIFKIYYGVLLQSTLFSVTIFRAAVQTSIKQRSIRIHSPMGCFLYLTFQYQISHFFQVNCDFTKIVVKLAIKRHSKFYIPILEAPVYTRASYLRYTAAFMCLDLSKKSHMFFNITQSAHILFLRITRRLIKPHIKFLRLYGCSKGQGSTVLIPKIYYGNLCHSFIRHFLQQIPILFLILKIFNRMCRVIRTLF